MEKKNASISAPFPQVAGGTAVLGLCTRDPHTAEILEAGLCRKGNQAHTHTHTHTLKHSERLLTDWGPFFEDVSVLAQQASFSVCPAERRVRRRGERPKNEGGGGGGAERLREGGP